ncbi:hypothetical protein [Mangrovicoccus ximenensis]|uniref:hypothetical protein n=1 Tax=Mangrovicoccus ximenensis TaxID=1911570 RepID=UPI000D38ABEA|nr:hypothetical protein [Mangrovicoccus ximenensis]
MAGGDIIPARQATLGALDETSGAPVIGYVEEDHMMSDSSAAAGTFRPAGVFGVRLGEALVTEGSYTFHARARLQSGDCTLTREVQWSHHVAVGIDPEATPVTVTPSGDGDGAVVVTFTPQDRYGNLVGPGAADSFEVAPLPGPTAWQAAAPSPPAGSRHGKASLAFDAGNLAVATVERPEHRDIRPEPGVPPAPDMAALTGMGRMTGRRR